MKKNKFTEKVENKIIDIDKIIKKMIKDADVTDLVIDKIIELSKKHLGTTKIPDQNYMKMFFDKNNIMIMYEILIRYDEHQRIEEYFKQLRGK